MKQITTDLEFRSLRGLVLRGTLHQPAAETTGAVVVCHGMLSSRLSEKHVAICQQAAKYGLAALRFDFAGRGESQGGFEDLTISGEIEDLNAAISLMRDHGFPRPSLVGSSLGGTVAILCTAEEPSIGALVSVAAPAILPTQARPAWGSPVHVGERFFADARQHDVPTAAALVTCPWLIIHGEDDEIVPPADARLLAAANPRARLLMRPAADHRFAAPSEQRWLVETIVNELL